MDIIPPPRWLPETGVQHIPFLMVFARRVKANFSRRRPTDWDASQGGDSFLLLGGVRSNNRMPRNPASKRDNELRHTAGCQTGCHLPERLRAPFGVICCAAPIACGTLGCRHYLQVRELVRLIFRALTCSRLFYQRKKMACTNIAHHWARLESFTRGGKRMDATVTERVGPMRSGRRAWSAISLFSAMLMAMGLSLYSAQPAYATIVTNGGFEAGDFSGWTQFGDSDFTSVGCPPNGSPVFVAEGNCAASFGPFGDTGGISQELTLHVGTHYLLSFALMPDGGIPSSFSVSLGNVSFSLDNPAASGYQTYTFDVFATSALENLVFTFRDDPGFLFLDAVNLAIPEPGTIALLAIGLAGLLVMGLRRKM
jgi:hypothetical protein